MTSPTRASAKEVGEGSTGCQRRAVRAPAAHKSEASSPSTSKSEESHATFFDKAGAVETVPAWSRHRIFGAMTIIFFARGTSLLLPAVGPKILLAHVGLAAIPLCFAKFTSGRVYKVWHDAIFCLLGFLMLLYMTRVTVPLYADFFPGAEPRNGILGFILWEHCLLLMSVHPACLAIFDVVVVLFCPVGSGNLSSRIDLAIVFAVIMITNILLERTRAAALRATAEAMRARTLTEQRQKRQLEQCIALVFRHVKAPLLLAKSELSANQDLKKAAHCASTRIQQIWTMLNGLQKEIENQFNVRFLSEDAQSRLQVSEHGKELDDAPEAVLQSFYTSPAPSVSTAVAAVDEQCKWMVLPAEATVSVEVVVDDRDSLGFRAGGVHVHIPGSLQGSRTFRPPWCPLFASDEQDRFLHWLVQSSNAAFNGHRACDFDEDLFFELPHLGQATLKCQKLRVRSTSLDEKNQIAVSLQMSRLSISSAK